MGHFKTKIIIDPKEKFHKPTNSYILYHFIKTRNLTAKIPQEENYQMKENKTLIFLTIYILYTTKESRD